MKAVICLLAVFAVAYGNPGADSKVWHWKPRMPTVSPNPKAVAFPDDILPKQKIQRVPGTWRADSCGPTSLVSPVVVNGNEATPHSYPWQVALYIDDMYFCGGSLISDEWVLTAAHCTTGSQSISVVLGAHDLTENEASQVTITSTGSDIYTHEDYGSVLLKNDVGLVHLSSPVTFTTEIQPICLPRYSDADLGAGVMLTASGWGVTSDGALASVSDTLNEVTNPSISNTECAETYGATITDASICTSTADGNKGTCSGDSGGPLNYVSGGLTYSRGVTSFVSSSGCMSGLPDGFTRTNHYLDWIELHTGIAINA